MSFVVELPAGPHASSSCSRSAARRALPSDSRTNERPFASTAEYRAIQSEYGLRTAKRSKVLLMRHIDEGLEILRRLGASDLAMRAFCLHPLLQEDAAFSLNASSVAALTEPTVLALALEYRRIANATLSDRPIGSADDIPLSSSAEVNQMLIADKVQNRKDFLRHHRGRHPRSDALDRYFRLWLERLGVTEQRFGELVEGLDAVEATAP